MKIKGNTFQKYSWKYANKKLINSIGEYREYINYFIHRWGDNLWFRGVSNSTFRLTPSIYRKKVWTYDFDQAKDIFNNFIHRARSYLAGGNIGKWEWYQIMQHHNLPTRLLDWTEGSYIALYFACRLPDSQATPSVWILDPFHLNKISSKNETIYFTDTLTREKEDSIVDDYLNDDVEMPDYPIAINPPYVNKRMSAQKSCFTVHGENKFGFENLYRNNKNFHLVQLKISGKAAQKIKKELVNGGISESTLFPDLEGLAREIRFDFDMDKI